MQEAAAQVGLCIQCGDRQPCQGIQAAMLEALVKLYSGVRHLCPEDSRPPATPVGFLPLSVSSKLQVLGWPQLQLPVQQLAEPTFSLFCHQLSPACLLSCLENSFWPEEPVMMPSKVVK